jgi:hypothetical protein
MNDKPGGLTRRDVGLALVAASSVAVAQQPSADDLLASARDQVKENSETLRKFKVPTATEPSFVFRP